MESKRPSWYWHVSLPFHSAAKDEENLAGLQWWDPVRQQGKVTLIRLLGKDMNSFGLAVDTQTQVRAATRDATVLGFDFPLMDLQELYPRARWTRFQCWAWSDQILIFQAGRAESPLLRVFGWAKPAAEPGVVVHGGWVADESMDEVEIVRLRYIRSSQPEWQIVAGVLREAAIKPSGSAHDVLNDSQSQAMVDALGLE